MPAGNDVTSDANISRCSRDRSCREEATVPISQKMITGTASTVLRTVTLDVHDAPYIERIVPCRPQLREGFRQAVVLSWWR